MNKNDKRIILENENSDFIFQKNKSNLNVNFNRISFIFFVFFIICIIYSIHLIHLGSRQIKAENNGKIKFLKNNLYRADIVDINHKYLVKTVNSIDIGISPIKIIDEKKLLINLRYIFPDKDFDEIKKRIDKGKFFYLEKNF